MAGSAQLVIVTSRAKILLVSYNELTQASSRAARELNGLQFQRKVIIAYISFVLLHVLHVINGWYVSSYEYFVWLKIIIYIIFIIITIFKL